MEIIKNYVDTMFVNLPQTEELLAIKEDILLNMVEKFQELIAEGKPENEAIGTVIAEFGNINELLETLEIEREEVIIDKEAQPSVKLISDSVISDYLATKKYSGLMVASGVASILIGISLFILFINRASLLLGWLFLFLGIIGGITLFIISGMRLSKFSYLENGFILKDNDRELLIDAKEDYRRSFILSIVIGVALCISSIIPAILTQVIDMPDYIAFSMLLIFVATGCFFFIYSGNIQGSYTFLLENGFDECISKKEIARKQNIKRFESLYWGIILTIFFVWGFVFEGWHICWIVFPIGGVLSGFIQENI